MKPTVDEVGDAREYLAAQCAEVGDPVSDIPYQYGSGPVADLAWHSRHVAVFLETEAGWRDTRTPDGWRHLHIHVYSVWTGGALERIRKALSKRGGRREDNSS